MQIMNLGKSALLLSVVAAVGCGGADSLAGDDDGIDVGTSSAAFTGAYQQWVFVTGLHEEDLGPHTLLTPFLNAVTGNLAAPCGNSQVWAHRGYGASTSATYNNDLTVWPCTGSKLGGGGTSVNSVTNRTSEVSIFQWGGTDTVPLGAVTAKRRCFLTRVNNTAPDDSNDLATFRYSGDRLETFNDGTNWFLRATGHVSGRAACMDVTTALGQASWNGSGTVNLGPALTGKFCFLTAVGGRFRNNNWSDGVIIEFNAALSRWELRVSSGKFGTAECDI